MRQDQRSRAGLWAGALGLVMVLGASARAQELLTNGSLDVPGLHEQDLAVGWTLEELPPLDLTGAPMNSATFVTFGNHTPPPAPPDSTAQVGLWLRSFAGTTFDDPNRPPATAHLTQTVPAVPGETYVMSGWARFEAGWSGGMEFLPSGGTTNQRWPSNTPSPTRTEFALEFIDAGNAVLPGSIVIDLFRDGGQTNDNQWHQHTLMAVAPAGTVSVRVRGSMIDGVHSDLNPQSAFFDDFSLIPEPASLGLLAIGGVKMLGRRRGRRC